MFKEIKMHNREEGEISESVKGGKMGSMLCCERLCNAVSILYTNPRGDGRGQNRQWNVSLLDSLKIVAQVRALLLTGGPRAVPCLNQDFWECGTSDPPRELPNLNL